MVLYKSMYKYMYVAHIYACMRDLHEKFFGRNFWHLSNEWVEKEFLSKFQMEQRKNVTLVGKDL